MKKSLKITLIVAVLVIIVLLILFFIPKKKPSNVSSVSTVVQLEKVTDNLMPMTVSAMGTLVAPETLMIKARTDGLVSAVNFKAGDCVKKGDVLVQLQNETQHADLVQSQAIYLQAEAQYARYATMQKTDPEAVSAAQMDELRSTMNSTQAKVESNRQLLEDTTLSAPFSGCVGSLQSVDDDSANTEVTVGAYLSAGDPIVVLSNVEKMMVQYQIPEAYSKYLKIGQTVQMTTDVYPGVQFTGTVQVISPIVYQSSRAFDVRALLDASSYILKSGMNVMVTQLLVSDRHVLTISGLSLVPTFTGYNVYKIENDKVQLVPVKIGERYNERVEIMSGLKAGDEIISSNVSNLSPGQSVSVSVS